MPELSNEDIKEILDILRDADFDQVDLEFGELKLRVSRGPLSPASAPPSAGGATSPAVPLPSPEVPAPDAATVGGTDEGASPSAEPDAPRAGDVITAPMVGVFYAGPQPGAPPFVEIGQQVEPGTTVGLIEVMKMFTGVSADRAGRITARMVDDGQFVEYGEELFRLEVTDVGSQP